MITRIVKMSFKPDQVSHFESLFNQYKVRIAQAPGCVSLTLLREHDNTTFFTYSVWNSVEDLERYRNSELFAQVWSQTKTFFDAKPEAWTTVELFTSQANS